MEEYKGCQIEAYTIDKEVYCKVYRPTAKIKMINLGECNDGSMFQSERHAINQAKEFINICEKNGY